MLVIVQKYKIFLLILLTSLVGGGTSVLFKIALREIPPDLFTFLRFLAAFIVLLPFLFKKDGVLVQNRQKIILISVIGAVNVILYITGLQYTTAIVSSMLYAAAPFVVGILSWKIVKERISFNKWLGILIGFFGMLVLIFGPNLGVSPLSNGSILGNLIIGLAIISFSLYSVLSKKYESIYSPFILTKYFIITTLVVQLILMSFHLGTSFNLLKDISPIVWFCILYSGILGTTLYYFLYQYVLKRATPVLVSTTFYLQPIATIIWARLLLGEVITPIFFIGSMLIFIGITIVFYGQYLIRPKVNA